MKNKNKLFSILITIFILFCLYSAAASEGFTGLNDYQRWTVTRGYPQGILVPLGVDGINQDYFHSLPGTAGYTSGSIVIGDSRCCQLGIWQDWMGFDDFAVFAVWGGHYVSGTGTPALTGEHLAEVEECFHAQIRTHGRCTVFFFATVNDYDYSGNNNTGYISAAVASAERIASMSYAYEGTVYHPEVIVIGFDGGHTTGDIFGIPQKVFNRYVDSYNKELRDAVRNSPVLKETASRFTTVSEITGGKTTFISDGLHYSDNTLQKIADYMKKSAAEETEGKIAAEGKVPDHNIGSANETILYEKPGLIFYRIGY